MHRRIVRNAEKANGYKRTLKWAYVALSGVFFLSMEVRLKIMETTRTRSVPFLYGYS
jgi:hypothetical protein